MSFWPASSPSAARCLGDLMEMTGLRRNPPTPKREPVSALRPKINPDTICLNTLRQVLLEDQKLLAGNPIVKQVIDRYVDIVQNVDENGYNKAPIEPTVSFRTWINDLTVGHLERVRKKRQKLKYRQERKTREKQAKSLGKAKFDKTQRKRTNVNS